MPRLVTGDKKPSPFSAIYSIPALEEILQQISLGRNPQKSLS
jgi:hypothetical protein